MGYLNKDVQRSVNVQAAVFFAGLFLSLCFAAVILACSGRIDSEEVAKLNPNIAHIAELAQLPSMSSKKAQAIVDYRTSTNKEKPFAGADDLKKVKGIGEKTIEKIRPWIEFNTD